MTKFETTTAGLGSKLSMLQQKLTLQKSAVDQYQKALDAANIKLKESVANNDKTKASLDQARLKYDELGRQVQSAADRHRQYASTLGESDSATIAAKANLDALEQEYQAAGAEVKRLEGSLVATQKAMQTGADKVSAAQTALNSAQAELRETEAALKRCALELRASESLWTKAGAAMTKFGQSAKSIGKASSAVGKELNRYITAPIVALGGYAMKASVDMEDAFAGVRKTVRMTEDEYEQLDQAIKNMSTVKPANYETIAFVAETAGQLGVAKQAVEGFTSVMTDLGAVSTDLNAEEAATSLAKMANIMGVIEEKQTTEYFQRMGSTVLELGVNSATTEASIVQMAMRLAAAGRQVGMTEAEILGVSTALSSVGIEAQMGGTAFSKALVRMELACEEGGDELADFAKVAGMSAAEFKNLFKSDATAGMQAFIAGLARLGDEGISTIGTLQDIGFKEVRLRDTTLRMVNANELLTSSVQMAKQAWADNTAINDLVAERYNTTAKRLEMLKNKARLAASTFSGIMLPTMEDLMKTASGWLDKLTQMDEGQRKQVISIGLWAAAAGPLLSTFGKISSTVGSVSLTLGKFSSKVGEAGGGLKGLVSVIGKSKLAMLGLVAAAGAGVYMLYDWASGAKACREALEGMNATAEKWKQTQASTIYSNGGLESFGLSKEQFAATGRTTKQWLADMIATWTDGRNETDEIVSSYTQSFAALTDNTKSALDELRQTAQESGHVDIASNIQKDMDKLDKVNAQIAKLLKKKQNKKLTEQDKIKLQELIDTKESIEVKYKLTPEQIGGYGQILQGIETEVARAQARGQKGADPKVYAQGLTATAEGYAAVREQIDQRYASEYALIQLMEDGAEKDEARSKLDADYNEQRKSAAEDYANALQQVLGPVWDQPGIQKAGDDMDSLMQLFREYSTLGSAGYKDPAILEKMNQLFEGMDKDTRAAAHWTRVNPVSALLDPDDGLCAQWQAEIVRDDWDIVVLREAGFNRGVRIEYAKNLLGVKCEVDSTDVITRVIPVGQTAKGAVLLMAGSAPWVDSPKINDYPTPHVFVLDLGSQVKAKSTKSADVTTARNKLKAKAQAKFDDEECDLPSVSLKVDFLNLGDTEEYREYAQLESLFLYDRVRVRHPDLMIDTLCEVKRMEFNCLTGRAEKIELGSVKFLAKAQPIAKWQMPSGINAGIKLAWDSIDAQLLCTGSVTAKSLSVGAVEEEAILDGAVSPPKLSEGFFEADEIQAAVATIALANITTANIQNANIDWASITNLATQIATIAQAQITSATIEQANIDWAAIATLNTQIATIAAAQITTASINSADIDWAEIASLQAGIAQIVNARISAADIDYARIKDMVTDSAIITTGAAGQLYINRLCVTEANMVSLTVGELMIKGEDGLFYKLTAGPDGTVTTVPVQVEGSNVADATLSGSNLIEDTITCRELNVGSIFADSAMIGAIQAANIDVSDLFASNTYTSALRTSIIQSDIGSALDISSNEAILLKADKSAVDGLSTTIEQLTTSITMAVKSDDLERYLRMTIDGLTIGLAGNAMSLLLTNDRISFRQSGNELSYWAGSMQHIKRIEITDELRIGNAVLRPNMSGGLRLQRA